MLLGYLLSEPVALSVLPYTFSVECRQDLTFDNFLFCAKRCVNVCPYMPQSTALKKYCFGIVSETQVLAIGNKHQPDPVPSFPTFPPPRHL